MREKIAFVVHRYGEGVDGGAAAHCRAVAEHLTAVYDTEILTSTSKNYPYKPFFETGEEILNDVLIRRFELERLPDEKRQQQYRQKMMDGDREASLKWMEEVGPYCPELINYLKEHALEYKAVFFFGYNHYLTYAGMELNLPNNILISLAHDEGTIYKRVYRYVFEKAGAFLFNTPEERDLVYSLFGRQDAPCRVTCYGLDIDEPDLDPDFNSDIRDPYIIYVGRVTQNKNFAELNKFFIQYKKRNDNNLKLVVLGRVPDGFNIQAHEDIILKGSVSEEEKKELIRGSVLLVLPSRVESLSIVVLESFLQKRPVLVNGVCPVLVGQMKRSNGGLYYNNYAEFEAELNFMLENPRVRFDMGRNGLEFVKENYSWDKVIENFKGIIEDLGRG